MVADTNAEIKLPLRLNTNKKKMLLLLVVSLIFVVMGIALMMSKSNLTSVSYGIVFFFGLCALVAIIQLLPSASYLLLTKDGFTMCSIFRATTYRWCDIEKFFVITVVINEMVGLDFAKGFREAQAMRAISKGISGADGALPDTYGMRVEDLTTLMNRVLAQSRRNL
jgi:hypothetical protein